MRARSTTTPPPICRGGLDVTGDEANSGLSTFVLTKTVQAAWLASLKKLETLPKGQRTVLTYILAPYIASTAANAIWFWDRYKILYKDGKREQYPIREVLKQSLYAQMFLLATSMSKSVPRPLEFGKTLLLMAFVDDLWFYINHRTLHTNKWLWENVHSLHHKMMNPTALSTNFLHPLEMLLVSIGTIAAAAVVRPHYVPFLFFIFIRTAEDVGNHSGWDFPFLPSHWIPGHVTARFHDTHHALSNYQGKAKNLATTFTFWDKIFGSYSKGYQKKKVN
ncbi:fatty acid hydroxylase superfamily-domain-containing protein [Chytridium lagenaria]|nr:fatty acid hydroxylase superfamily-domain-containing protein [Chytridium lagenaria]